MDTPLIRLKEKSDQQMAGIEPMARAQPLKYDHWLFNADKTEGSLQKAILFSFST